MEVSEGPGGEQSGEMRRPKEGPSMGLGWSPGRVVSDGRNQGRTAPEGGEPKACLGKLLGKDLLISNSTRGVAPRGRGPVLSPSLSLHFSRLLEGGPGLQC